MTTSVKVSVHCSDDKEVVVTQQEGANSTDTVLPSGAVQEFYCYPGKLVFVTERVKE